jgi:NADH-quinone oxidoreductase subunit N
MLYSLGVLSLLVGSILAANQISLMRLLAYSTIVDMGFIFLTLSFGDVIGIHTGLVYLAIHIFSSLAFISFILSINFKNRDLNLISITDVKFLFAYPQLAYTVLISMLSYMAIPPLIGFYGKAYIIASLLYREAYFSVLFLILIILLSLFYYSRIIRNLYMQIKTQYAFITLIADTVYYEIVILAFLTCFSIVIIDDCLSLGLYYTSSFFLNANII